MRPSKPAFHISYTSLEGYMMSRAVTCMPTRSAPNMGCNMLNEGGQEGKIRTTNGVDVNLVAF